MAAMLALACAALVIGLISPTPDALVQGCRRCEDRGVSACRRCAKDPCTAERPFLFCSVSAQCKDCAGVGFVHCERCEAPPEIDLAKRRAEIEVWQTRVAPVDAFMKRELRHAASAHFVLTFDITKIDVGKPHQAMHIYLDRLEAHMERFQSDLGAVDEDFRAPTRVMLWSRARDQEKASLQYTRQPSTTESKLMGAEPVVSIFYDKGHLHEEFELHQAVVHQVTHCLLSNVWDGIWPGNIKGGWLDEGLAHWYETHLFGGVRHYCYVENDTMFDFKFGRWEPEVRQAVDRDEELGVLAVTGRNTVEMTPEERMFAWSLVDWHMRARPGKLGPIARDIKAKRPLKDTFEEHLEATPFEVDAAWKTWVRETYSPKKRPR